MPLLIRPFQVIPFFGCLCFALVGAVGAIPLWQPAWDHWRTHREQQMQLADLSQTVTALQQQARTQTTPSLSSATPDAVRASLQSLAQAQSLQDWQLQMGLPQTLSTKLWWCPFQVQAQGTSAQWMRWWQDVQRHHAGSVMKGLQLQAQPNANVQAQWQLQVPCAIAPEWASAETQASMDDPFDLPAWKRLHTQRDQAHASFRALAPRWSQARTPLERFTLEQLRYVAYLHNAHRHMALLKVQNADDNEQTHTVEMGQPLGAQLGVVTRINEQALEVQEWLRDASGVWRQHRVSLPMQGVQP